MHNRFYILAGVLALVAVAGGILILLGAQQSEHLKAHRGGKRIIRTLRAGEGFLAQSSQWIHFRLGEETVINRLVVRWPGGDRQTLTGFEPDRRYYENPRMLDTLAAAYAAAGRAAEATETVRRAIDLATAAAETELATQLEARLQQYQSQHPPTID